MENGRYYQVRAKKLAEGSKCVVWAEIGSGATEFLARQVALEYDTKIRPRIVNAFGEKDFTENYDNIEYHFDDILDYANWLAGRNDKKLTILLLDIKDGYNDPGTDPFVAGYFSMANFFGAGPLYVNSAIHYSNSRDMIYIDTVPGLEKNAEQTYATLAHELQHLINFVTSVRYRSYEGTLSTMDTWVDEGLSAYAEYLYLDKNLSGRCEWFSNDREGTIAKGNNFFVWGNHSDVKAAILDDYATVYLFFRWLYLQANDPHIMYNIETSRDFDYKAVTAEAAKIDPAWKDWEALLMNWLAANNAPRNLRYGYKGDFYLQNIIKVNPVEKETTISLHPGEGVYSIIKGSYTPSFSVSSPNIRYAGLGNTISTIGTFTQGTSDVLLTFNANTENYIEGKGVPNPEEGRLTGISSIDSLDASLQLARNVLTREFTGPYVIDASDLLGRGERKFPNILGPFKNEDD
jgi:hypothetical protein